MKKKSIVSNCSVSLAKPENLKTTFKCVRSYESLVAQKKQIVQENGGKCGIYLIRNTATGKCYVGSSVNLGRRLHHYFCIQSMKNVLKRSTMLIYFAILKYGIASFKLEVLEDCDPSVVRERESYYIQVLNPEYNILRIGGSLLGFKHSEISRMKIRKAKLGTKLSLETRALISESSRLQKRSKHSEETRAKIKAALTGKKLSATTIAKIKAKLTGVARKKLSEETRAKIRQARLGRVHSEESRAKLSAARQKNIRGTKV